MNGIDMKQAAEALSHFTGIKRRMQVVGQRKDVTLIDDFAHNPDKISATLSALKSFEGRLLIMFQPHGFAPMRLMGAEMIDAFKQFLSDDDILIMPEVYYAGGTVDRSVTARDVIDLAVEKGLQAHWFATRAEAAPFILKQAKQGDRIVIMGARDDSLTLFAQDILAAL